MSPEFLCLLILLLVSIGGKIGAIDNILLTFSMLIVSVLIMSFQQSFTNCIAFQLARAQTLTRDWYVEHLKPINLTPSAVYVLGLIKDNRATTPSVMAEQLNIKKPSMTTLLDRMQRDGWISRSRNQKNRKQVLVRLTASGEKIIVQAYEILNHADKMLEKQLGQSIQPLKTELDSFIQHYKKEVY